VFKKGKNFSRKKIVPIRIPALTIGNIEKRKRFVQQVLPYMVDE